MPRLLLFLALASSAVAEPIIIRAARVLDGRGQVLRNAAVVVDGTKIIAIERNPKKAGIDLGDATLMPGLIDTHVHIGWHFDASGKSDPGEKDATAESVARAVRAGCTSIEHGALIDQATLDLMAEHGVYFDPNTDLIFRNYFENTDLGGAGRFLARWFGKLHSHHGHREDSPRAR